VEKLKSELELKVVSFPCPNEFTYAFCREMNTKWRHGIPAVKVEDGVNGVGKTKLNYKKIDYYLYIFNG